MTQRVRTCCREPQGRGAGAERLDAVEELIHNAELRAAALEGLRGLPDLERLVSRVFAGGRDVQQVAWVDAEVASRKQVTLFLSTVGGLRRVWSAARRGHGPGHGIGIWMAQFGGGG